MRLKRQPTWLYRHFSHEGTLLYVGITASLHNRALQHRRMSPWWDDVDHQRTTIQWYPNRPSALYAEALAIRSEAPRFNRSRPSGKQVAGLRESIESLGKDLPERDCVPRTAPVHSGLSEANAWNELSGRDRQFMLAMLEDEGPSRMTDIGRRMTGSPGPGTLNIYRLRLLKSGLVQQVGRGRLAFSSSQVRASLERALDASLPAEGKSAQTSTFRLEVRDLPVDRVPQRPPFSFFNGRLAFLAALHDLSVKDREFLKVMAEDDGPSNIGVIAERLGKDHGYVSQYRARLLAAELVRTAGRGLLEYTLPYMREYLRDLDSGY